ncbi:tetraacyldisaccharide 4'-kinase [Marinobacter caseinilyticus]|uniref:tetraacyldisaccharide 4'-kinase n=1 Tax=Marinobacter caseinilyticus TaxID=2692195 RepID=UPI001409DB91|nr:tetraacyldisaccharide 4'-kinase [Marinobacter caseinilyticus]
MMGQVDRLWYGTGRPLWMLWPLAWLYQAIAGRRRKRALKANESEPPLPAPVIVVGNITAGGTGKSPLTAWLAALLKDEGWHPVILTRGYGARATQYPLLAGPDTPASQAGDEPVMLAAITGCPVVVDPKRVRAARWAVSQHLGNIFICDDGLQHYALPRDIEVVVFDGERGFGNGAPIPVGPLREPRSRLATVDFVVCNGSAVEGIEHPSQYVMTLNPTLLRHLQTGKTRPVDWLAGQRVKAVAGIGNPGRFFSTLTALGARVNGQAFPDHHRFAPEDLNVAPGEVLVMTAKDAVKCKAFAQDDCWVLEVSASFPDHFKKSVMSAVAGIRVSSPSE